MISTLRADLYKTSLRESVISAEMPQCNGVSCATEKTFRSKAEGRLARGGVSREFGKLLPSKF